MVFHDPTNHGWDRGGRDIPTLPELSDFVGRLRLQMLQERLRQTAARRIWRAWQHFLTRDVGNRTTPRGIRAATNRRIQRHINARRFAHFRIRPERRR